MLHRGSLIMAVDVETQIEIKRPRSVVAAYACDPDNATAWYQNIKSVEWKSSKPLAVGSRIAFVAQFLGRTLTYTYEVKDLVPEERFVQGAEDGPFPMETTYTWADTASGGTKMTLRNRGEPTGFSKFVSPLMASAMRRTNQKDLAHLKGILESSDPVGAENGIRAGHATSRYSWIRPKTASLRRKSAGPGSSIGGGESIVNGERCPRARCGRWSL
jgi:Polyketide cyclase / dehydrase and lipid transport